MFKIVDPVPTGPVAEHVYAVKDGNVNLFILCTGHTGCTGDWADAMKDWHEAR